MELTIEELSKLIHENRDQILEDAWDNFDLMYKDMKEHAKNNGKAILPYDRPVNSSLGWICENTGKTWSITIKNWKKWLDSQDQLTRDTFSLTFSSSDGRKVFNDMINS